MNSNELQNAWNSPRNNLPTEEQQRLADQFSRQMIHRRRFQSIWLTNTFVWLTIVTVLAIQMAVVGKITAQEWGLFPLLLVPWGFALYFLRRHLKPVAPMARGEMSIVNSMRAALASNREERSHLKLVGVLYVIMLPLLALGMPQLHLVGKVSDRELTSMAFFFSLVLLGGGLGITIRYFRFLVPQQRRLIALMTVIADEAH